MYVQDDNLRFSARGDWLYLFLPSWPLQMPVVSRKISPDWMEAAAGSPGDGAVVGEKKGRLRTHACAYPNISKCPQGSCLTPSRSARCIAVSCSIDYTTAVHQIWALSLITNSFPELCVYDIKKKKNGELFNTAEQTPGSSGTVSCCMIPLYGGGSQEAALKHHFPRCRQTGPKPFNVFLTVSWTSLATELEAVGSDIIIILH